jgi:hypothetical protein
LVTNDFEVSFRLTLPVKADHIYLFENPRWIVSYIRKDKIRYMLVYESKDKNEVLKIMRGAQVLIADQKIKEMTIRKDRLMEQLAVII